MSRILNPVKIPELMLDYSKTWKTDGDKYKIQQILNIYNEKNSLKDLKTLFFNIQYLIYYIKGFSPFLLETELRKFLTKYDSHLKKSERNNISRAVRIIQENTHLIRECPPYLKQLIYQDGLLDNFVLE
ncbi:MAG: hypothetical protein GF353_17405 [Candidatus Lokiarchaeota archaeon]|nr:hypothetical protein [Candidatus Lokiarchaeota archaeon]